MEVCEHGLFVRLESFAADVDEVEAGDTYGLPYGRIMYPVLAGDNMEQPACC